jgi:DNA-binding CsgD family transcriptional regulator
MLLGRVPERDRIDRLVAGAREGRSGALLLRGEAGVGKTALLEYSAGSADGFRVLRAIGIESEASLAFSGLMQLTRPVLGALDHVPEAQREGLERALGLGLGDAGAHETFLAYAGTLSLLAAAAEEQPLLCLVDDAHWLDSSSADALAFAARRIEAERIAMVFAARPREGRGVDVRGVEELAVGGLDEPAARELLAAGPAPVAPAVAHRLIVTTEGNPLALIELPAILSAEQRAGREPLDVPLLAGESVERAFLSRARALSDAARGALLVAAASDRGDLDIIVSAAGEYGGALDEAEAAGLVRVRGGELAFRHPLVRSAVYFGAPAGERRAAHAALAEAIGVSDPGRRAWHLAEAALGPGDEVARALEEAASAAGRRSIEDEGRLLERAARLTPDPAERAPRLLRAGAALHEAGRAEEAMALLDQGLSLAEDPLLRADLHETRLYVARALGTVGANVETCLAEAERVEALDPLRAAAILYHATYQAFELYDLERSGALCRRLEELTAATDEPSLPALGALAWQALCAGGSEEVRAPALRGADAALALDRLDEKAVDFAECLTFIEDYALARRLLERAVPEYRARARVVDLVRALDALANLELRLGNFARASVAAHEAVQLSEDGALDYWIAWSRARLAAVEAVIGREDECRANVHRAVAICRETGDRETEAHAHDALGRLELGLGRTEQAIAALSEAAAIAGGVTHPGYILWRPDLVEAFMRAGRESDAARLLSVLEETTAAGPWAAAVTARCHALLADDDAAFEEAYARCDERVSSFERARTELVWGERLRRSGHRLAARERLVAALAELERLGASSWSARAREELRASGQTVRRGGPAVTERLTPRELEIALHAAAGLTNREIGARLFLSPKTVELHLGRVYRKLGLRSRTELASAMPSGSAQARETPYSDVGR